MMALAKQRVIARGVFVAKQVRRWSGARVRELREEMGLTQEELGHVVRYTDIQISRIENGHSPVPEGLALLMLVLANRLRKG